MNKQSHFKLLLIDVGGVLLTNGWDHGNRAQAAQKFELDLQELNQRHSLVFPVYEIGKLTLEEYLNYVIFFCPRPFGLEDVRQFIFSQSQPLQEMLDYLANVKARASFPIGILSNEGKELTDYRVQTFGLNRLADFMVFSGYVGFRKPDPDIYRLALNLAHCQPHEALYIDDRLGLVEFARTLNLPSHQHTEVQSTKDLIEQSFFS